MSRLRILVLNALRICRQAFLFQQALIARLAQHRVWAMSPLTAVTEGRLTARDKRLPSGRHPAPPPLAGSHAAGAASQCPAASSGRQEVHRF